MIGLLLILAICVWTGAYYSARVRRRPREINRFIRLFTAIQSEIEFALRPTDALLKKLAAQNEFSDFRFLQTVNRLFQSGESLQYAWEQAAEELQNSGALQQEEITLIRSFCSAFGNTDRAGQRANCTYLIAQLETVEATALTASRKKGGLYRTLGVLGGIFLVILFL